MAPQRPRYSAEETARRGDEIYEREVSARVEAGNHGKVVAVDIETSAYALDESALASAKRLRARCPNTEIWFVRVGHRANPPHTTPDIGGAGDAAGRYRCARRPEQGRTVPA